MLESLKQIFFENKIDVNFQKIYLKNADFSDNVFKPFTIAQISDLHITKWNIELIEKAVSIINSLNPDLIVVTGDVICHGKRFIPEIKNFFNKLNARVGKYACLGNHDHSDGCDGKRIINAYNKSDFRILINESELINLNGLDLNIAGADDIELGNQNIKKTVKKIKEGEKSIFLVHNPINFEEFVKYNPDIIFAGHTHGGQFDLPFLKYFYCYLSGIKYISGMYKQGNSYLYVNRGLGTALLSPEVLNKKFYIKTPRINSIPEITVFTVC